MRTFALTTLAALPLVYTQQIGNVREIRPELTTQTCTKEQGCTTHQTSVVLDALTHPIEDIHTGQSCIKAGGKLNEDVCSTAEECGRVCAIEGKWIGWRSFLLERIHMTLLPGTNYHNHGVETDGDSMTLHMYLHVNGHNEAVSPRVYLLNEDGKDYSMLKLLGREVSFDADVSKLPCGMNGALYVSCAGVTSM